MTEAQSPGVFDLDGSGGGALEQEAQRRRTAVALDWCRSGFVHWLSLSLAE